MSIENANKVGRPKRTEPARTFTAKMKESAVVLLKKKAIEEGITASQLLENLIEKYVEETKETTN